MLYNIIFYDATGGGAMAALAPTSATISVDSEIVGYYSGGTSAQMAVLTATGDSRWEAGGFYLENTGVATVDGNPDPVKWLAHRIPVAANTVLACTSTSGANPHYVILYLDDGAGPAYAPPMRPGEGRAMYVNFQSAASGVNTTAATCQMLYATTTITTFTKPRHYKLQKLAVFTAMTGPSLFVGISKGQDAHVTFWPLANTPAAVNWKVYDLPSSGLPEFENGERMNVHWLSEAAEQPRLNATFAYSA